MRRNLRRVGRAIGMGIRVRMRVRVRGRLRCRSPAVESIPFANNGWHRNVVRTLFGIDNVWRITALLRNRILCRILTVLTFVTHEFSFPAVRGTACAAIVRRFPDVVGKPFQSSSLLKQKTRHTPITQMSMQQVFILRRASAPKKLLLMKLNSEGFR